MLETDVYLQITLCSMQRGGGTLKNCRVYLGTVNFLEFFLGILSVIIVVVVQWFVVYQVLPPPPTNVTLLGLVDFKAKSCFYFRVGIPIIS